MSIFAKQQTVSQQQQQQQLSRGKPIHRAIIECISLDEENWLIEI